MRAGLVSEADAEADTHWHAAPRRYDEPESPASRRYARPTVGSIMIQLEVVKLKISQPDGLLVSVEPASPAGGPKRSMTTGAGAADSGRPAPSSPSQ
jgi:hypothetical protein